MKLNKYEIKTYFCERFRSAFLDDLVSVLLFAASAPTAELSRRSRRLSAAEGAALKIRCKVGGNPAPRVDWFKDGLPIGGFRTRIRNKRRRSTLRIRDLQGRDSGNYSCRLESFFKIINYLVYNK